MAWCRSHAAAAAAVDGEVLVLGGRSAAWEPADGLLRVELRGACTLLGVLPERLPAAGGVELDLIGKGFRVGAVAVVRFSWALAPPRSRRRAGAAGVGVRAAAGEALATVAAPGVTEVTEVEVAATVLSPERAQCTVPELSEHIIEGRVQVELVVRSHPDDTACELCTCTHDLMLVGHTHGPGCIVKGAGADGGTAGARCAFKLLARDKRRRRRLVGGDAIELRVREPADDVGTSAAAAAVSLAAGDTAAVAAAMSIGAYGEPESLPSTDKGHGPRIAACDGSCTDHETGVYSLEYTAPTLAGRYTLELWINGVLGVRRPLVVRPAAVDASMVHMTLSEPSTRAEAGSQLWLSLQPRDRYGNHCSLAAARLAPQLSHSSSSPDGAAVAASRADQPPPVAAPLAVEEPTMPRGPLLVSLMREAAGDYELRLSLLSERAARRKQCAPRGEADGVGWCIPSPRDEADGVGGAGSGSSPSPPGSRGSPGPSGSRASSRADGGSRNGSRQEARPVVVPGTTRFHIYPAATSPTHCRLVERTGEYALCGRAAPPRRFLQLREEGYTFTLLMCDRFGNTCARPDDSCVLSVRPSASKNASNAALRAAQHSEWASVVLEKGDAVTSELSGEAADSPHAPPLRATLAGALLRGGPGQADGIDTAHGTQETALAAAARKLLTVELETQPRGDGSFGACIPGAWPEPALALTLDPAAVTAARRPTAGAPLSGAFWLSVVVNGDADAELRELLHLGNPALGLSRMFHPSDRELCCWQMAWLEGWVKAGRSLSEEHPKVDASGLRDLLAPYAQELQAAFAARCDPALLPHLRDGVAADRASELKLTNYQWWALCKACKLSGLGQFQLDEMLPGGRGPVHGADLSAFLHTLPLVAARKFPGEAPERAIERLVREHLLVYMPVPETELMTFTRHVVERHEPELLRCYAEWASSDSRDEQNKLLSCKEVMVMLHTAKLVGRELTIMQVRLALMGTLFDAPPRTWQHKFEKMHLVFSEIGRAHV